MYNVNITGSFTGVFPNTVQIDTRHHGYAIQHYKRAFNARERSLGSRVTLESSHGFRFRVDAVRSPSMRSVRLALPYTANRMKVAEKLGRHVSRTRQGLKVTDPYNVTWYIA